MSERDEYNGYILIDKPAQITSFGVVARVRRVLSQAAGKKVKVGHTGTLDPFATGLMVLVTGSECKQAERYSKQDKEYEATFVLGQVSSTGDPEGELTTLSSRRPTLEDIQAVLPRYIGTITQTPPQYSAIKINGKRAYKLAREGIAVEMPSRTVTVYTMAVVDYAHPELRICTRVSSGTYIRSLAESIGEALGVGAYCSELRRTVVGGWRIDDAVALDEFM